MMVKIRPNIGCLLSLIVFSEHQFQYASRKALCVYACAVNMFTSSTFVVYCDVN